MTVRENIARHFPLHYQRIVELTHASHLEKILERQSQDRWRDLAGLFVWGESEEGHDYWEALAQ